MNKADVAEYLDIAIESVAELVKLGEIKSYGPKGSRQRVYHLDEVAQLRPAVAMPDEPAAPPAAPPVGKPYAGPIDRTRETHLYIVEIPGVCCKVGISKNPIDRVGAHVRAATAYGRVSGRVWLSWPHEEAWRNESVLKGHAATEYLAISFENIVARAEVLPMSRWLGPVAPPPRVFASFADMTGALRGPSSACNRQVRPPGIHTCGCVTALDLTGGAR